MATEYVPPSDEDTEYGDIFHAIIQFNSKVTQIQPFEYHLRDRDDGNAVYTNLTSFQIPTGTYFSLIFYISFIYNFSITKAIFYLINLFFRFP